MKSKETQLKPHKSKLKRVKPVAYALLIPNMLLLAVFTFFPFARAIYLSFFVTDPMGHPAKFVGFANYERVFTSENFINSIQVTLKFAAMVGVGTFVVAIIFAYLCVDQVRGSKLYTTMFALPMAIASAPICAIALYFFAKNGFINNIFGSEIMWLSQESTALMTCAIITVWSGVGGSFIYLLVGFRNVPETLVESSKIDGANSWHRFRNIYWPIASPQIFYVMFLNILGSLKAFAIIQILVGAGPNRSTEVIVYALYSSAFSRGRFETACVYALVLCALIFVATRIQLVCEKRMVHYQ